MMKYDITVKGLAKATFWVGDDEVDCLDEEINELDGLDCDEFLSEYFYDVSASSVLSGGWMHFKYESGELFTYTVYESNRELSQVELDELAKYTQGQWSDGIGENFEQQPQFLENSNKEIFVSAWYRGQKLETYQERQRDAHLE